jgi:hypothetical protein
VKIKKRYIIKNEIMNDVQIDDHVTFFSDTLKLLNPTLNINEQVYAYKQDLIDLNKQYIYGYLPIYEVKTIELDNNDVDYINNLSEWLLNFVRWVE